MVDFRHASFSQHVCSDRASVDVTEAFWLTPPPRDLDPFAAASDLEGQLQRRTAHICGHPRVSESAARLATVARDPRQWHAWIVVSFLLERILQAGGGPVIKDTGAAMDAQCLHRDLLQDKTTMNIGFPDLGGG
jgi:hypothetical protein